MNIRSESSTSRPKYFFSHISRDRLPREVETLLRENDQLRWLYQGFRGGWGLRLDSEIDLVLADQLAKHGISPEHIVSALLQRPAEGRRSEEDLVRLAETAFFDSLK